MNELSKEYSCLIQASYLIPDLSTTILEIIWHLITKNRNNSLEMHISINISNEEINLVVENNQNFWDLKSLQHNFFNIDKSFYYYLGNLSKNVKVMSRPEGFASTWCIESASKDNQPFIYQEDFQTSFGKNGMLVAVDFLFYNIPVRAKYLTKILTPDVIEREFKHMLYYASNIWPDVKVQLTGNINGSVRQLDMPPNSRFDNISLLFKSNFSYFFLSQSKLDALNCKAIKVDHKLYQITGFISSKGYSTQQYQTVYYNNKELILSKKWTWKNFNLNFSKVHGFNSQQFLTKTVGNNQRTYPIIVLKFNTKNNNQEVLDLAEPELKYSRFAKLRNGHLTGANTTRVLLILERLIQTFIENLLSDGININAKRKTKQLYYCGDTSSQDVGITSTDFEENKIKRDKALFKKRNYVDPVCYRKRAKYSNSLTELNLGGYDLVKCHNHNPNQSRHNFQEDNYEIFAKQLYRCRVISQIENKFILSTLDSFILIFDQHAADERIKLELLLKKYIMSLVNQNLSEVELNETFILHSLSQQEMSLFQKHHKSLLILGILIVKKDDSRVEIRNVPDFLANKVQEDAEFLINGIWQYIWELEEKIKTSIETDKITNENWWTCVSNLPIIILDIFNSKACQQAVKFGDNLSLEQCKLLIHDLSKCNMPFYCAHGRSALYPFNYKGLAENIKMQDYTI